jgi:hypothetical protein
MAWNRATTPLPVEFVDDVGQVGGPQVPQFFPGYGQLEGIARAPQGLDQVPGEDAGAPPGSHQQSGDAGQSRPSQAAQKSGRADVNSHDAKGVLGPAQLDVVYADHLASAQVDDLLVHDVLAQQYVVGPFLVQAHGLGGPGHGELARRIEQLALADPERSILPAPHQVAADEAGLVALHGHEVPEPARHVTLGSPYGLTQQLTEKKDVRRFHAPAPPASVVPQGH